MKVALVYDRVNKWGGAERVLLALHKIFPNAPLYTSVYHPQKVPWAKVFKVRTSFLQNFPFAKAHHELYAALMPLAFESFNFDEYDLVISVTSEAAKGIITKPDTLHICYLLTPTRYLWSGYEDYFKNPILKFISKPIVLYLRSWDKVAAQRPDRLIAISREVQERIKKYYDRDSSIIYPPLMLSSGIISEGVKLSHLEGVKVSQTSNIKHQSIRVAPSPTKDYFLIVSRLVPYKKIDLAIRVFNKLNLPLKIIGAGSQKRELKAISEDNIKFLGDLTDSDLVKYYKECRALIFPGKEDFGLAIVEAQSFGKPVIAYNGGGARETIVNEKTGIFFDNQTQKDLEKAILSFMDKKFDPRASFDNSRKFSFESFKNKLLSNI